MAHDLLSPSSAVIWCNCPGAMALVDEMAITEESSVYAAEGTAAHAQADLALKSRLRGDIYVPSTTDADMIRHATGWADVISELVNPSSLAFWSTERPLDISVVTRRPNAVGTADFVSISEGGMLTIADFKYGMGVEVEADHNLQLTIYALAAASEFDYLVKINAVRLVIYQPRISSQPKIFQCSIDELQADGRRITAAAKTASRLIGDHAEAVGCLRPGDAQCRFCKAKSICPAMRAKTKELIAADFDVVEAEPPKSIPVPGQADELSRALPWLDAIESWCDAVRANALALATNGTSVPGYKIVAGKRGARKWVAGAEEKLRSMRISRTLLYTKSLISPTQAEKAMKAGRIGPRQWANIESCITQADGKPVLVPETDKRPAISVSTKDEFNVIEAN